MKHGDIWLVQFPFTDGSSSKLRPVLVVSVDEFNSGDDVVVVPFSSSPSPSDPYCINFPVSSPFFPASGLRTSSSIKWSKVMTISRRRLKRRLGRLHQDVMAEVFKHERANDCTPGNRG